MARHEPTQFAYERMMQSAAVMVRRAHQICTSIYFDETRDHSITPLQYCALYLLALHPGVDQTALGRLAAMDRTTTATVVRNLEGRGLLRREIRDHDRRARYLFTTDAGRALVEAMTPAVERARDRITQPLTPAEREQFQRLLTKLVEANNIFSRAPMGGDQR